TLQAALLELSATLAARSDEAAQVEARIAELLGQDAALDRAVAAGILPGQYRMGPVSARFTSDGRFEMANADSGEEVTGRYTVEEGRLTLDRVEGDTGWLEFPVECEVAPEALGFSLQGSNGCEMFSGTLFEKVRWASVQLSVRLGTACGSVRFRAPPVERVSHPTPLSRGSRRLEH